MGSLLPSPGILGVATHDDEQQQSGRGRAMINIGTWLAKLQGRGSAQSGACSWRNLDALEHHVAAAGVICCQHSLLLMLNT